MSHLGRFAFILAAAVCLVVAAHAETAPENDDNRFTFHQSEDGYLRLDGRSGQVSICSRQPAGWLCRLLPDERAVMEGEIRRLQTDNSALKKELLARNLPLPGSVKPDAPAAKVDEPRVSLPSDEELDRMMGVVEKFWRRFVDMVVTAQRDMMKKP